MTQLNLPKPECTHPPLAWLGAGDVLREACGGRPDPDQWDRIWIALLKAIEEDDQPLPEALLTALRSVTRVRGRGGVLATAFPTTRAWHALTLGTPPDGQEFARMAHRVMSWLHEDRIRSAGPDDVHFIQRAMAVVALAPACPGADAWWRGVLTEGSERIRRQAVRWLQLRHRRRSPGIGALIDDVERG